MRAIKLRYKQAKHIKFIFVFSFAFTILFYTIFGFSIPQGFNNQDNKINQTILKNNDALATSGLIKENLQKFSQNNILFYKPSECEPGSNGTCGATFKEKYWSALSQKFDSAHAAAILGNIVHEGGGPTKWEYKAVRNGQFVNGWTWEKLYNECESSCAIGVGAYQITSGLSNYLHYINEKAPDLIKYFEDPSYSISGDNLISKIGESEFEKLMQIESDYVFDVMLKNHHAFKMDEFLATTTPGEAARYWAHNYEICAACGYNGGDSQLIARASTATLIYAEMRNFTCINSDSSQIWKGQTYNLTEGQIYGLTHMAKKEQNLTSSSGIMGIKFEASIMANLNERYNKGSQNLVSYVLLPTGKGQKGWFGPETRKVYTEQRGTLTDEEIDAVKSVLVDGNRVIPPQVLEHDGVGEGIKSIELDGKKVDKWDAKNYIRGKTIIRARGDPYVFYSWCDGEISKTKVPRGDMCDPFGYFVNNPPSINQSSTSVSVSTDNASSDEAVADSSTSTSTLGKFVWYSQKDSRWANAPFGSSTVGPSGCGPSSFAMLATMLLNKEITPDETAKIAGDGNMYEPGQGAKHDITKYLADHYGLQYEFIQASSQAEAIAKINDYLKKGWMIHVSGGSLYGTGDIPFSRRGHYIGIRGITEDNKWLLADSGHAEKYSTDPWSPGAVMAAGLNIENINAIRSSGGTNTVSNICSGNSNSTSVSESGLTYEQAKQLAINYGANKNNSSRNAMGVNAWNLCNGGGSNCVSFSKFFVSKFTNTHNISLPDGKNVVNKLKNAYGISTGTEPRVWAVFSWSGGIYGHTGVILGYENGEWIVGNASCRRQKRGAGNGTKEGSGSAFIVKSSNIVTAALGGSNGMQYAYFDDQVDHAAILNYLNSGE